MFRGNNTVDYWEKKHTEQYEVNTEYDFTTIEDSSYVKIASDILGINGESFERNSILDVGCAAGYAIEYFKQNHPEWECTGYDFSKTAIDAATIKSPLCTFECRDILLNPIEADFGYITCLETIEHIEEGVNYKIIDNILDHCEYAFISTVDTVDDCFGEHISHYTLDTFDIRGYPVLWKSNLEDINMPDGIYHYIGFLLKGKL